MTARMLVTDNQTSKDKRVRPTNQIGVYPAG